MTDIPTVEMAKAWNGPEGDDWAGDWQRYGKGARGYHGRLLEAAAGAPGERGRPRRAVMEEHETTFGA